MDTSGKRSQQEGNETSEENSNPSSLIKGFDGKTNDGRMRTKRMNTDQLCTLLSKRVSRLKGVNEGTTESGSY